jgi:DNA repair protein RadC
MSQAFIVGEVKLTYHRQLEFKGQVRNSTDAVKLLRELYNKDIMEHHEEFWVLFLNRANKVIGFQQLSVGGLNGCVVDVRHLFQAALLSNACGLIVCHNHPSGNTQASEADIDITKKIRQCGDLMDIKLLDHVILTSDSHKSLAEEGLI